MILKKVIDQKDIELKILIDQRRREGINRVNQDREDDLQTSLEALVVTENNSQELAQEDPQDTSQADPQDTSQGISLVAPNTTEGDTEVVTEKT